MALFAAYADRAKETNVEERSADKSWLENSSFKIDLHPNIATTVEESASNDWKVVDEISEEGNTSVSSLKAPKRKKKEKKKKHHKKIKEEKSPVTIKEDDIFVIDNNRTKEYLTVATISRPAAPKYHVAFYISSTMKKRRKHKFKRYFNRILDKNLDKSNSENEIILTKKNLNKVAGSSKDENFTGFKQEEELSQKTAEFNRQLGLEPNDIKTWLDYVQFQDTVYHFEKSYRKGSIAKAQRVLAERKLAILDKALSLNPGCELLLRERLKIAVSAFPADELQEQLKNIVDKEKGNIVLWQGYIEATQCSMSHCNTPAVINLYSKCLSTLHQLRRTTILEKYLLEESILRMLYQCGLFLKQAGLFEQLWTLLRMYLELNLSQNDKTKFNISSGFKENQLLEMEELVFKSQLPLHELWLRTEKLRESCHWLPYVDDAECEDPQRIVFTEDVAELIHPITMPENIFKLTATIFSLLKIPLLPCRHTTMQDLGLDYVPWSLDSIEPLLSVFLSLYPVDLSNNYLLNDSRLTVGPQYLKVIPGQEEYLEFILILMRNCADCLNGDDKTVIMVWWFRFQRLLVILERLQRFKMAEPFKKKMKKNMKQLLKQEENRQSEIFYIEYALVEYELDSKESCVNILNTALNVNSNVQLKMREWDRSQAVRCYLYRTLIQVTLNLDSDQENMKKKALTYLCEFVLQKKSIELSESVLKEAESRFKLYTLQLQQNDLEKLPLLQHFLPDFFTDFLICHGWFVYLTKGPIECGVFLERTLQTLDEKNKNLLWQKEVLYEFYSAMLFKYCSEQPGCGIFRILDEVLYRAIEQYPNNLFLLTVLTKEQSLVHSVGKQWWKMQDLLLKSGRAFSILFAIIIANQQIMHLQEILTDTVTGERYDIDTSIKNRMLSLFKKITKPDMCTRRCGLVWRLYLQFVHTYFPLDLCRNVYYSAVEECPWLKALYIDAAIYIPAELAQIQDLIIEKQLRLHVTPEELDILRS